MGTGTGTRGRPTHELAEVISELRDISELSRALPPVASIPGGIRMFLDVDAWRKIHNGGALLRSVLHLVWSSDDGTETHPHTARLLSCRQQRMSDVSDTRDA